MNDEPGGKISASEIDQLLLSFCKSRWLKVARVIADTQQMLEGRGISMSSDLFDAMDVRLAILVRTGRLEAKGDIRRWRFSEIRLPVSLQQAQDRP